MAMLARLLRGSEVAQILNISKALAYRLMADGEIPTVRLGRAVRVRPEDLSQFLEDSVHPRDPGWPSVRQMGDVEDSLGSE
jgi:excisionase family DNA binding protein